MKREVDPKTTNRAIAFELWTKSPMPMVTLVKTFDVTRLLKKIKHHGMKFTMLMCWCIARAASRIKEFYMLPVEDKLMQYDSMSVNVIVPNAKGGLSFCDIPFDDDFQKFSEAYTRMTTLCAAESRDMTDDSRVIVGTSVLTGTDVDVIVNQWSGRYTNPFLAWARYRKGLFKTTLPVSFQFHHAQMDGAEAVQFLNALQQEINSFRYP